MAYIDAAYYTDTFKGTAISESEFDRLADIASDLVYAICAVKPSEEVQTLSDFKKAVAYEVEFLYEQGGLEAIYGRSDASQSGGSESLADYSVSGGNSTQDAVKTYDGIPCSSMMLMLLEKLGLLTAWVYAYRYEGK